MFDIQSQEKIDLLRMLGADVRPVPAVAYENPQNYNHQAREYAKMVPNSVWTDQFDNTANTHAHYISTGPEIWEQTGGKLDGFICATGTGGTLAGVGRYLREKSAGKVQVWLADPPGSVLYSYISSGGKLTERSGSSITEGHSFLVSPAESLTVRLGIGQGRITKNLGTEIEYISGALHIADSKSIAMVYDLLDREGLYLGASSALNVVAAVELAQKLGRGMESTPCLKCTLTQVQPGSTIATILCDGAYRYQSRLFSKKWLQEKGLIDAVPSHLKKYAVLD